MSSGSWKRTHTCGELREEHVGQAVVLNGWVARRRDLGGIFFVDLRDRYGITQIALTQEQGDAVPFSTEFVLSVKGEVVRRESPNAELPTGAVELRVEHFEVRSSHLGLVCSPRALGLIAELLARRLEILTASPRPEG